MITEYRLPMNLAIATTPLIKLDINATVSIFYIEQFVTYTTLFVNTFVQLPN